MRRIRASRRPAVLRRTVAGSKDCSAWLRPNAASFRNPGTLREGGIAGQLKLAGTVFWAGETERQQTASSDADAQRLLERILKMRPDNEAVLLDIAHLAARRNDVGAVAGGGGPPGAECRELARTCQTTINAVTTSGHGVGFPHRRHSGSVPSQHARAGTSYRQSLDEVKAPATTVGEPF